MKSLKFIYYVLVLFCIAVFSSCDSVLNTPKIENKDEGGTRMSLVINTPSSITGNASYQYEEECYIKDVAVYIFETDKDGNDKFKEQVISPVLSGSNGLSGYRVNSKLNLNYAGTRVKVVVLTNLAARGVQAPTLNVGSDPDDLFSLAYNFEVGSTWEFQSSEGNAQYAPMYGVSTTTIMDGTINTINISLYRAIARVDVVFNDGAGFDYFTPTSVQLNSYNTKGTCAANDITQTNVPAGSSIGSNATFFKPSKGVSIYNGNTKSSNAVWRLYIPEYKNIGNSNTANLTINGNLGQENKTYTLDFIDTDNVQVDIVRNNLYIFKITSITQTATVTGYSLEVAEWTSVNNKVTFN